MPCNEASTVADEVGHGSELENLEEASTDEDCLGADSEDRINAAKPKTKEITNIQSHTSISFLCVLLRAESK